MALVISVRAYVFLMALVALGNAEALAVTAPLPVEPLSAAPREDLFAAKPRSALPDAPSLPTPVQPPARAAPAAERVSTGNPLWGIPLSRLIAIRERPLFAPTRLPPAAVAPRPPAVPMMAASKPIEPETPQLSLVGTVAGGEKIGLFIDSASKSVVRLKAGDIHKGWTLRDVRPRQAELARGLDIAVLELPVPDMKAGAAPPPAMSAVTPASTAFPVNNTRPTGMPAMPQPAAGATIVLQQPVFKQPPAQANPFQQGRMP